MIPRFRLFLVTIALACAFSGAALAAQQPVNRGQAPGDGKGESAYSAFGKLNANDAELYGSVQALTNAVAGKAAAAHSHPISAIIGLQEALNAVSGPQGAITNSSVSPSAGIEAGKLSFTKSGTGGVSRSVDSVLQERLQSVRDRGALCNGAADDGAAIAVADGQGPWFIPPLTTCRIATDRAFESDVVFGYGAAITVPSGVTVTFRGDITAPYTQRIFPIGAGVGRVLLTGQRSEVFAEWWGAKANGTTLSTAAFQAAHEACSSGCTIRALAGRYLLDGTKPVTFTTRGVNLVGSGSGSTIFGPHVNGTTPLLAFANQQVRIADFQINPLELSPAPAPNTRPSHGWTTEGIRLLPGFGAPASVEGLYIANTGRAIWAQSAHDVYFGRIRILNCSTCFTTGGIVNYHFSQTHLDHVSINPGSGSMTDTIALLMETNTISNTFATLEIAGGGIGVQVQSTVEASPAWAPNTAVNAGAHRYHGDLVYKALNAGTTGPATTTSPGPRQPVGADDVTDGVVTWHAVAAYTGSPAKPAWAPRTDYYEDDEVQNGGVVYKAMNTGKSGPAGGPRVPIGYTTQAAGIAPPGTVQDAPDGTVQWLGVTAYGTSITRPGNNWIRHSNIDFAQLAAAWIRSATYLEIATSTLSGVQQGPGLLVDVQAGRPANEIDGVMVKDTLIGGNGTHGVNWISGTNLTIRNSQVYANNQLTTGGHYNSYANVRIGPNARGLFEFTSNMCGFNSATNAAGWGNNLTSAPYCLSFANGALKDWTAWAPSANYALGAVRKNTYGVYTVTTAGTSAAVNGPTGFGSAIEDGTVVWTYTEPNAGGAVNVQGNTMLRNSIGGIQDLGLATLTANKMIRNNLGVPD